MTNEDLRRIIRRQRIDDDAGTVWKRENAARQAQERHVPAISDRDPVIVQSISACQTPLAT